jgi:hypothetical protein
LSCLAATSRRLPTGTRQSHGYSSGRWSWRSRVWTVLRLNAAHAPQVNRNKRQQRACGCPTIDLSRLSCRRGVRGRAAAQSIAQPRPPCIAQLAAATYLHLAAVLGADPTRCPVQLLHSAQHSFCVDLIVARVAPMKSQDEHCLRAEFEEMSEPVCNC